MSDIDKSKIIKKIDELYLKYNYDTNLINKLNSIIINDVENMLINFKNNQEYRENRKNFLIEGHDKFIKDFLANNLFYYYSSSEIFFKYNKVDFSICKEDDIIVEILKKISECVNDYYDCNTNNNYKSISNTLLSWKFKIKTSVIKKIKEISLFTCIPESETIQIVINIFKQLFNSKNECKYFLCILGDIILKKNTTNIYITTPKAKVFLRLLENLTAKYFIHYPFVNSFKFKFYEHNFSDCRLINFNFDYSEEFYNDYLLNLLKKNIINIVVVSCYLSIRYGNSDLFLDSIQDEFKNHILYLKNNNIDKIIDDFIDKKLQISVDSFISFKNMVFIWKSYLDEKNIPNILFLNNLKNVLDKKIALNEKDEYTGYTSLTLPIVQSFIKFWDENLIESIDEYFLEIEEIFVYFKNSINNKKIMLNLNEKILLSLIRHYYPDTLIENEKYIYGFKCIVYDKKEELKIFLDNYKKSKNDKYNEYTGDDKDEETIYKMFIKQSKYSISKIYFEQFLKDYNMNNE